MCQQVFLRLVRGGADIVTLPPDLLAGLRGIEGEDLGARHFVPPMDIPESAPVYFSLNGPTDEDLAIFDRDSKLEAISLDKVPEGLAKFSVDAAKLEQKLRGIVEKGSQAHVARPVDKLETRVQVVSVVGDTGKRVPVN